MKNDISKNVEVKLILDNNAHKVLYNIEGKQSKITISPFKEMSFITAKVIVDQVNEILSAKFTLHELKKMYEVANKFSSISKYNTRAILIGAKILYSTENDDFIIIESDDDENNLTILNIGCTSVGKTLGNIYAIVPVKHANLFSPLSSIKESTNFRIGFYINDVVKVLDEKDFLIEISLKDEGRIRDDVSELVREALNEILDSLKDEARSNDDAHSIWIKALEAGYKRLSVNKSKTFDVSGLVVIAEGEERLKTLFLKALRKNIMVSNSYNKIDDELIVDILIKDIKEKVFDLKFSEVIYEVVTIDEFEMIVNDIANQLFALKKRLEETEGVDRVGENEFKIKGNYKADNASQLIEIVFGNKKKRRKKNYYTVEALILEAKIFFRNSKINNGKKVIIVDGLGINQGQIAKEDSSSVAYNRVHAAVQEVRPDIIIYNSRLDSKDDYMIEVIKDLNNQGYKNRLNVVYGRFDTVIERYCEEEDMKLDNITSEYMDDFIEYINSEYVHKELLSYIDEKEKVYFCDKPCRLSNDNIDFSLWQPQSVLNSIISNYENVVTTEKNRINQEKITEIMNYMSEVDLYSKVFHEFINSIDDMIPMDYNSLRWNTLEYAIKELMYDRQGFAKLYPSIQLKKIFAERFVSDELKEIIGNKYNDVVKEILNGWTELIHTMMVTSFRSIYENLYRMRFEKDKRKLLHITLTDERKLIIVNTLSTCFFKDGVTGSEVFREITEEVLNKVIF